METTTIELRAVPDSHVKLIKEYCDISGGAVDFLYAQCTHFPTHTECDVKLQIHKGSVVSHIFLIGEHVGQKTK